MTRRASRPAAALATLALLLTGCSTFKSAGPDSTPEILPTPDPNRTVQIGTSFSAPSGSVAVLAIDDFGGPGPTPSTSSQANCTYPTGTFGSKGGGGGLPTDMHHGVAVFNELYGLFTNGLKSSSTPYRFEDLGTYGVKLPVEVWPHANASIMLVGVDSADFDTATISDRLRSVIATLVKHGVERFVLNMSFVIAPCDPKQWLDDIGYASTNNVKVIAEAYRRDIGQNGDISYLNNVINGLVDPQKAWTALWIEPDASFAEAKSHLSIGTLTRLLYGDVASVFGKSDNGVTLTQAQQKLQQTLVEQLHDRTQLGKLLAGYVSSDGNPKVIPVAAAGNGFDFDPAVPPTPTTGATPTATCAATAAATPTATPTGPPDPTRGLRLDFPFAPAMWNTVVSVSSLAPDHDGDLRAWYSNSGEVILDGRVWLNVSSCPNPWPINGTSFAAPRLSYLEARYLLGGGAVTCDGHVPALGYADSDAGFYTWNNEEYPAVATDKCGTFVGAASL
jgi:hypothetical protein